MTTILDGKKVRLFKFQEDIAQKIAKKFYGNESCVINIPTGFGRRLILQRVVDIMNPKKVDIMNPKKS